MWDMQKAFASDRVMKALTGLSVAEFQKLEPVFEVAYEERQCQGQPRRRAVGGGRKHTLSTITAKLFFVLCYLKCYPTFDRMAFYFGVHLSQAHRWVHGLVPLLEKALGRAAVLPQRSLRHLEEFKKLFPETPSIFIDGTERPLQRSQQAERQKATYSGKKKRHTVKNLVVTACNREVLLLSATEDGKRHDYALFEESQFGDRIPTDVLVAVDLGFQGIEKAHPQLKALIPHKKPKKQELNAQQRQDNRLISSFRLLVEHALAGVKRLRSVSDVYRNRKKGFEETLMLMACGLWNFHLKISENPC